MGRRTPRHSLGTTSSTEMWCPSSTGRRWEGPFEKKPWDYPINIAIPVIGDNPNLALAIDLWRAQTISPYITIVDTGSTAAELAELEKLRAPDVEVHSLRFGGCLHPSDPPAIAMDFIQSACRSPYLFCTHSDVFPRQRDLLEWMRDAAMDYDFVGYEITPRHGFDWRGMISHTATMIKMETADMIGLGWSQRRLCTISGIPHGGPSAKTGGFPDTEVLMNIIMRERGIEPKLIGIEKNYERTCDNYIDHCRSLPSSGLYSPGYHETALSWMEDAVEQAKIRLEEWTTVAENG